MPDVERRDRRHGAARTPEQFEDLAIAIQNQAARVSVVYSDLYEIAYSRPSFGSGGRSSGTSKPTESAFLTTRPMRDQLENACDGLQYAFNSLNSADTALTQLGEAIDRAHPLSAEPIEPQRERTAQLQDLIESHEAKARDLKRELATEERRVAKRRKGA